MANRTFNKDWGSLTKGLVSLCGSFTTTTNGTIGSTITWPGQGITSVARTAAGRYLITLQDRYTAFIGADATLTVASGAAYAGAKASNAFIIRSVAVTVSPAVLTLQFLNGSNVDTDVDDAVTVFFNITLSNSSAK